MRDDHHKKPDHPGCYKNISTDGPEFKMENPLFQTEETIDRHTAVQQNESDDDETDDIGKG